MEQNQGGKMGSFSTGRRWTRGFNNVSRSVSTLCDLYLAVPQSEGDMVELVTVSRFDGGGHHAGVDSDFPCSCVARVVGDTWVRARLQDVADAVIAHKHHGHAP